MRSLPPPRPQSSIDVKALEPFDWLAVLLLGILIFRLAVLVLS